MGLASSGREALYRLLDSIQMSQLTGIKASVSASVCDSAILPPAAGGRCRNDTLHINEGFQLHARISHFDTSLFSVVPVFSPLLTL